jgi:hypothetical protein
MGADIGAMFGLFLGEAMFSAEVILVSFVASLSTSFG